MRSTTNRIARLGPRAGQAIGIALGIALTVAACGGGGAGGGGLGYEAAPASLDPNSPRLAAQNIAFDRNVVAVPANTPFVLVFENRDSVSHNVSIYQDPSYDKQSFQGVLFSGPATRWYPVPALAPGTYSFKCDLHPNMTGQIVTS
jgi:hypothetical protein